MNTCVSYTTGIQDNNGQPPLDIALNLLFVEGCIDVSVYLIRKGYGSKKDAGRLLCGGCQYGRLDIVKELVEKHNVGVTGEATLYYLNKDYSTTSIFFRFK